MKTIKGVPSKFDSVVTGASIIRHRRTVRTISFLSTKLDVEQLKIIKIVYIEFVVAKRRKPQNN